MTAATTPNAGDGWSWPLQKPPISPNPPLELQFLPPSSSSVTAAACPRPPRTKPWTVDPSRLQKLMMGTIATSASSCTTGHGVAKAGPSVATGDLGAFLDPGINQPLPSGWERCLDLKSGEVFIKKKSEGAAKGGMGPSHAQVGGAQRKDWKQPCVGHTVQAVQEQRSDWSHKWMNGSRTTLPMQSLATNGNGWSYLNGDAKIHVKEEGSSSPPERKPLCLDLDLSLTSMNRSRLTSETPYMTSLNSSIKLAASTPSSTATLQSWKWQAPTTNTRIEKPTSIQEMISESTMATAVCSKCLMYVLLKKSNPTCPRCLNPIILDCGFHLSSLQKKPRLELSPDELSLSTDSSR